jgi:serine protease Do
MKLNRLPLAVRILTLLVFVVPIACRIGTPTPAPATEPESGPAPTPTVEAPASAPESQAVSSLDDVKTATVQIEAQGTFVDPEYGLLQNAAGTGSGFIIDESGIAVTNNHVVTGAAIDESGIAVTNNHVVTGAAIVKVWVGGESEPRNARILGVSECSDLAVIDIEGDGYPYLEWYAGAVAPALDVYTAGFPLGDPEFTMTRGIVSKERAGGETSWASIDYAIEHDATINPGNSGGPLVTEDGQVVAVNYASDPSLNQYFAIARDEATEVIERLRQEQHVDSIGVNGTAVNDGEGFSGIWVSSVKSGSPADNAGVEGGDIITSLEGLTLATDGTMADYCDVLRSHSPNDTLSIEVVRFNTQEVLEGQLNGQALEAAFSFAQELDEEVGGTAEDSATYANYEAITDDSAAMVIEVPQEWTEVDGSGWERDDASGTVGAAIVSSPDIQGFYDTYSTPGVFFGASESLAQSYDTSGMLDEITFSGDCTYDGRFDYQDPLYSGIYDLYSDCGGVGSSIINLSAVPEDGGFIMLLQIMVTSDADLDALDHILNTFEVIGDL